jgi:hypothetical protein
MPEVASVVATLTNAQDALSGSSLPKTTNRLGRVLSCLNAAGTAMTKATVGGLARNRSTQVADFHSAASWLQSAVAAARLTAEPAGQVVVLPVLSAAAVMTRP